MLPGPTFFALISCMQLKNGIMECWNNRNDIKYNQDAYVSCTSIGSIKTTSQFLLSFHSSRLFTWVPVHVNVYFIIQISIK